MSLILIESKEQFEDIKSSYINGQILVINFWASWAKPCQAQNKVFKELAKTQDLIFIQIEAEEYPEITQMFNIKSNGIVIDQVIGASAQNLTLKVDKYSTSKKEIHGIENDNNKGTLEQRIKKLLNEHMIIVFIKGTPSTPKCGFSRKIVDILNKKGIIYSHFDILLDEEIRQGLKSYSNWPTYPQLYINGELAGGLDVVEELVSNGEFMDMIPPSCLNV